MTIARKYLIDYTKTCFYHCMSRCVRQDYLLSPRKTAKGVSNYRKDWIESRLLFLCNVFAIDLLAFSIMDNHTHKVLYANLYLANSWSNQEVLKRWSKIGKLPLLCQLYLEPKWRNKLNDVELAIVLEQIDQYRFRLSDISTLMSKFNYYVAKRANKEDGKSGHFWETRFKSQALLDSKAILNCMAYVDLNPIRAGKFQSLHKSKHTGIKKRLENSISIHECYLIPFRDTKDISQVNYPIRLKLSEYIKFLESVSNIQSAYSQTEEIKLFVDGKENWQYVANEFESIFTLSTGDEALVFNFNKQAFHDSRCIQKYKKALCDSIAFRLLDDQYQSGKMNPYN